VIEASNADTGTAPSCAARQMLIKRLGAHFWSTLIQNKCSNYRAPAARSCTSSGGKTLSHRRCRDGAIVIPQPSRRSSTLLTFLIRHSHVIETERERRPYQERGGPLPGQGQFRKWIIRDQVKPTTGSATSATSRWQPGLALRAKFRDVLTADVYAAFKAPAKRATPCRMSRSSSAAYPKTNPALLFAATARGCWYKSEMG
jgi:hypothetical protein